jgi:hypothetical protein
MNWRSNIFCFLGVVGIGCFRSVGMMFFGSLILLYEANGQSERLDLIQQKDVSACSVPRELCEVLESESLYFYRKQARFTRDY